MTDVKDLVLKTPLISEDDIDTVRVHWKIERSIWKRSTEQSIYALEVEGAGGANNDRRSDWRRTTSKFNDMLVIDAVGSTSTRRDVLRIRIAGQFINLEGLMLLAEVMVLNIRNGDVLSDCSVGSATWFNNATAWLVM